MIFELKKYAFETYADFIAWLGGTFTRDDGIVPNDLVVGDEILLVETDKPDYWLKSKSTPITIADFAITETDLSNYLAKDNTTEYTPTANYHPATKKYVDGKVFTTLQISNRNPDNNRPNILLYANNPEKYNIVYTIYSGVTINTANLISYYRESEILVDTIYILKFKDEKNNKIYTIEYNKPSDSLTFSTTLYENYTEAEQTKLAGIKPTQQHLTNNKWWSSDWQAVTGGYELAKTISGLTVYDSIVSVADDDTIWTERTLNAQ